MELGDEWIGKAYGTNEVPLCRDVPLSMYIDKIPLRSTSHLLKNVAQPSNAKIAAVATPQQSIQHPVSAPVPWSIFCFLVNCVCTFASFCENGGHCFLIPHIFVWGSCF